MTNEGGIAIPETITEHDHYIGQIPICQENRRYFTFSAQI